MTNLLARVRGALGSEWDTGCSLWEGLIRLYEADREAFYLLACDSVQAEPEVERLGSLARRVRKAIRSSYRLVPPSEAQGRVETTSDRFPIPADLFPRVREFLMQLDGKGVSQKPGKDYLGELVSEAEVRFKLGSSDEWIKDQQAVMAHNAAHPKVFKVTPQDLVSLKNQPTYVIYNLLKCARKVLLAPTAIYQGLNRGDDAPERLREGWAICGKPNRACDTDGRLIPTPPNMIFMVYADTQGFVFDWDWVQEDEHAPGHPLDPELRFGHLLTEAPELVLDLPSTLPEAKFDSTMAAYSDRGDCIFCYICDECGYAERINSDLTVFRAFGSNEVTGFKVKNVRKILRTEQGFVSKDTPDLEVSVQVILSGALKANRDDLRMYQLIIQAILKAWQPPSVHVPNQEINETALTGA